LILWIEIQAHYELLLIVKKVVRGNNEKNTIKRGQKLKKKLKKGVFPFFSFNIKNLIIFFYILLNQNDFLSKFD